MNDHLISIGHDKYIQYFWDHFCIQSSCLITDVSSVATTYFVHSIIRMWCEICCPALNHKQNIHVNATAASLHSGNWFVFGHLEAAVLAANTTPILALAS